jgi:hypothetical protein
MRRNTLSSGPLGIFPSILHNGHPQMACSYQAPVLYDYGRDYLGELHILHHQSEMIIDSYLGQTFDDDYQKSVWIFEFPEGQNVIIRLKQCLIIISDRLV